MESVPDPLADEIDWLNILISLMHATRGRTWGWWQLVDYRVQRENGGQEYMVLHFRYPECFFTQCVNNIFGCSKLFVRLAIATTYASARYCAVYDNNRRHVLELLVRVQAYQYQRLPDVLADFRQWP